MKVGVTESSKKLVRSIWAGHVEKMGDEKLAKRADIQKVKGEYKRGSPKLRWGIALKGTYKEWEKNGEMIDRRNWSLPTENVVREK